MPSEHVHPIFGQILRDFGLTVKPCPTCKGTQQMEREVYAPGMAEDHRGEAYHSEYRAALVQCDECSDGTVGGDR